MKYNKMGLTKNVLTDNYNKQNLFKAGLSYEKDSSFINNEHTINFSIKLWEKTGR